MKPKTIFYILILALILRLLSSNQSLWLDEATSAIVARDLSYSQILTEFIPKDFHPPLYYLLLKSWGSLVGYSEIALRSLSVIFGAATVFIVYKIGKTIKDNSNGVLAALLMAIAPLHIYYSQEARMYAMAAFFVSLSVLFFLKYLKNKVYFWGYIASLIIVFLTDYLSLLILPVFFVYIYINKRKQLKDFFLKHWPLVVVFALYLPVFLNQLSSGLAVETNASNWWNILGSTNFKNVALLPVKAMIGRISFDSKVIYGLVVLLVSGLYAYILKLDFKDRKKDSLLWLWIILPVILGAVIGVFLPVFSYFRFLFILPGFYLLVATSLSKIKTDEFLPILGLVIILNFVFGLTYLRNDRFHREDWKAFAQAVASNREENTRIVFPANSQMEGLNYYWPQAPIVAGNSYEPSKGDDVWLVRYVWDIFDTNDSTRIKIEDAGLEKKQEYDFRGIIVYRYE